MENVIYESWLECYNNINFISQNINVREIHLPRGLCPLTPDQTDNCPNHPDNCPNHPDNCPNRNPIARAAVGIAPTKRRIAPTARAAVGLALHNLIL